ncbi:MAG TPA: nucleoside/nucleotide kinase family protein [Pseudonocardia sp.]|nr:nucleoside/nucleotide kinase family protein [Pseudonocardia sp.]
MTFDELVARARAMAAGPRRALLGIAGAPGAGKSTLVAALLDALRADPPVVAHVPMDGFHLADAALERLGRRDRKGAPDTFDAGGYRALLRRLRADDPADDPLWAPGFERELEQPLAGLLAVPAAARLVLTEGNYLLLDGPWAGVRELLDEVWFCAPAEEVRLARLTARHVAFGKSPAAAAAWVAAVDGPNATLVAPGRERADIVVSAEVLDALPPAGPPG